MASSSVYFDRPRGRWTADGRCTHNRRFIEFDGWPFGSFEKMVLRRLTQEIEILKNNSVGLSEDTIRPS